MRRALLLAASIALLACSGEVVDDRRTSTGTGTGSSTSTSGSGGSGGAVTYRAINLTTGAPRFALLETDTSRDLCVRAVLIGALGEEIDLSAPVELAITATHDVADCALEPGAWPPPPLGESVEAIGAGGHVAVSGDGEGGCVVTVDADAYATFPAVSGGWVGTGEALGTGKSLPIEGGCP